MLSEASVFIVCLAGEVRKRLQDFSLIGGVDIVNLYSDGRGIISWDRNGFNTSYPIAYTSFPTASWVVLPGRPRH